MALTFSISAQTMEELELKYGSPNKEGIYQINETVSMFATFGEDKKLCFLTIGEKYSHRNKNKEDSQVFHSFPLDKDSILKTRLGSVYQDFLNNFFPKSTFGKVIKSDGAIGSCYSGNTVEYENVKISNRENYCGGNGFFIRSITMKWKREKCTKSIKSK